MLPFPFLNVVIRSQPLVSRIILLIYAILNRKIGCAKINLAQPIRFIHPIRMILYVEEYTLRGLA